MKLWKRRKKEEVTEEVIEEEPKRRNFTSYEDDDLAFLYDVESHRSSSYFTSVERPITDMKVACDLKKCVRPSSFTILTLIKLDVDIPGRSPDRLRNQDLLPTYKEYRVCDRCFETKIKGQGKTPVIFGPKRSYDPDKDRKTQVKLAAKKPSKKS